MSISHLYPSISPSLSLNFARSKTLDPRITFTRTSTGTRTNEQGLIEVVPTNSPRFDHSYDPVSGTVRSLGLLIEEQRSNLVKLSNDFSSNFWAGYCGGKSNITYNTTDVISPDGGNNSTKVARGSNGCDGSLSWGFHWNSSTGGIIIDTTNTFTASIYARGAVGGEVINVGFNDSQMTNHILTTSWQRISRTGIANTTDRGFQVKSDAINQTFYIWGAQLEQGSFPTSYIPTEGSTATRTVDAVSMTGTNFSSWFNQTEGTLFADFMGKTIRSSITYDRYIAIVGNDPNLDEMGFYTQTADGGGVYKKIGGVITNNGVSQIPGFVSGGGGPDFGGKAILAYKSNDASYTINGVTPVTDNTVEFPTFVEMRIFGRARYQPEPSGHISQLIYYPKRLSDLQLQALTK